MQKNGAAQVVFPAQHHFPSSFPPSWILGEGGWVSNYLQEGYEYFKLKTTRVILVITFIPFIWLLSWRKKAHTCPLVMGREMILPKYHR
jgi:hypothetical protein